MARPKARSAARIQQLDEARDQAHNAHTLSSLEKAVYDAESELSKLQQQIIDLESALESKTHQCSELSTSLLKAEQTSQELFLDLESEQNRYNLLYNRFRVECRAHQRGDTLKGKLEDEIHRLKAAQAEWASGMKKVADRTRETVESVLKLEQENLGLKDKLSQCFQQCQADLKCSHDKLLLAGDKLRESRLLASRLEKKCARAVGKQERAVKRAREQVLKEKSVYKLQHKGVYTEDTRHLVRLLVKAGCSRGLVSNIISAVLGSAGVIAIGKISRSTVSRIITEGYFAAQIQLGYELLNAESRCFNLLNVQ